MRVVTGSFEPTGRRSGDRNWRSAREMQLAAVVSVTGRRQLTAYRLGR